MPFGNRNICFTGSFQFSIVAIKKISPLWKPEIYLYRPFPKLKIAHLIFFSISLKLDFTPNTLGCFRLMSVLTVRLSFVNKGGRFKSKIEITYT